MFEVMKEGMLEGVESVCGGEGVGVRGQRKGLTTWEGKWSALI